MPTKEPGLSYMDKRNKVRAIAITGMLLSVMLLFNFTSIGFLRIGPIAVTFMHILVLIGLMSEGLTVGIILGFAFGFLSFLTTFTAPDPTYFIFQNPLISIPPRVLIPIVAWVVMKPIHRLTRDKYYSKHLSRTIGAIVGSLTNTVLILSLIGVFYLTRLAAALDMTNTQAASFILATGLTNGLPEGVLAGIVVPLVTAALDRIHR